MPRKFRTATKDAREHALSLGASDFLTKPFNATEVMLRAGNLLHTRRLHVQQQRQNEILEERVRERTRELEEAQFEIIDRLALAGDYRDDLTGANSTTYFFRRYPLPPP